MKFKLYNKDVVGYCYKCNELVVYRDNLCSKCFEFQLLKGIP